MPDIARLDKDGVIVAVETVSPADYKTDPQARTVALEPNHDMRERVNQYRWDFLAGHFVPLTAEPLATAEQDTPGLVEGLVAFVEKMEQDGAVLPAATKKAVRAYRATVDGRRGR